MNWTAVNQVEEVSVPQKTPCHREKGKKGGLLVADSVEHQTFPLVERAH